MVNKYLILNTSVEGLITYLPPLKNLPRPHIPFLPRLNKGIIFYSASQTKSLGINHSFFPFPHILPYPNQKSIQSDLSKMDLKIILLHCYCPCLTQPSLRLDCRLLFSPTHQTLATQRPEESIKYKSDHVRPLFSTPVVSHYSKIKSKLHYPSYLKH